MKTGSPLSNPRRISRFFHSTAEFYRTRFYTCAYTTLIMSPPPSENFSSVRSSISIFKSKDILYFFFLFQICHNFIIATFYQREALLPPFKSHPKPSLTPIHVPTKVRVPLCISVTTRQRRKRIRTTRPPPLPPSSSLPCPAVRSCLRGNYLYRSLGKGRPVVAAGVCLAIAAVIQLRKQRP